MERSNPPMILSWEDRAIEYKAPFDCCDQEQDYETVRKVFSKNDIKDEA
jgi:hypothetical protein